jgi:hypothetical protein
MLRPRLIGWLLVLVTLLAYLPILRNGFLNIDDTDYVTENLLSVRNNSLTLSIHWDIKTELFHYVSRRFALTLDLRCGEI